MLTDLQRLGAGAPAAQREAGLADGSLALITSMQGWQFVEQQVCSSYSLHLRNG